MSDSVGAIPVGELILNTWPDAKPVAYFWMEVSQQLLDAADPEVDVWEMAAETACQHLVREPIGELLFPLGLRLVRLMDIDLVEYDRTWPTGAHLVLGVRECRRI